MSNITQIWTADRGYAMTSACAVPSDVRFHGSDVAVRGTTRGAVEVQAVLMSKPTFDAGHRTWSPPIS
jgi:hypothetical protein